MLDITQGVEQSLEKIFSSVIVGGIDRNNPNFVNKQEVFRHSMPKFIAQFRYNIFESEYAFFYDVITSTKVRVFTKEQLRTIVMNNTQRILTSPYMGSGKWNDIMQDKMFTDDEKIEYFLAFINEKVDYLSNIYTTEEEFDASCKLYIDFYREEYMRYISNSMSMIMSDLGFDEKLPRGKYKHYQGSEEAEKFYLEKIQIIKSLDEENMILHEAIDEQWFEDEVAKESNGDEEEIISFGIAELDEYIGGLRRGNILGVLGPPKGGKTRFSAYMVERALEAGLNVAVWPLEGTKSEWTSMEVALMVRKFKESPMSLSSKKILERKYRDEYEKQNVLAAKKMLASDMSRGKLSFIRGTAYVEDFIDVLQAHYDRKNQYDIIVIDQLINILSKNGRGKADRISEGYILLKDFVANKLKVPAVAILPTQLKQTVIDNLRSNPTDTIDVTAGGESAETIRTPDEIIGLFSTKLERNNGQMKIYSVGSRHNGSFDDCYIGCELGCCYFYSKPELNS